MADRGRHPMRRALPVIAISAAGLTWLLNAQHVIDTDASARTTGPDDLESALGLTPTTVPTTTTTIRPTTTLPTTTTSTSTTSSTVPVSFKTPSTTQAPRSSAVPLIAGATPGLVMRTDYGPVQVAVVVEGTRVTEIQTVQYPDQDPRSKELNDVALPRLHDRALRFQSAQIDVVSGATMTSQGYKSSLQSALDIALG